MLFRLPYVETSAATGHNVDQAVKLLLDLVMKRYFVYVYSLTQKNLTEQTKLGLFL